MFLVKKHFLELMLVLKILSEAFKSALVPVAILFHCIILLEIKTCLTYLITLHFFKRKCSFPPSRQFCCCLYFQHYAMTRYPFTLYSDNHPTATRSQLEFALLSTPTVKLPLLITTLRPMCSINFMIRLMQRDQVIFIALRAPSQKQRNFKTRGSEVLIAPSALISPIYITLVKYLLLSNS